MDTPGQHLEPRPRPHRHRSQSPSSRSSGMGFHPFPQLTTLGYTNPRAIRLATTPLMSPVTTEPDPIADPHTFMRHRLRRGLSTEHVHTAGIISTEERSVTDFVDVPTDEAEVKRMPKKLRGYYEYINLIQEHYEEVDSLLAGELPSMIAGGFHNPVTPRRSYSALEDAIETAAEAHPHQHRRPWFVPPKHRDSHEENGEEINEATPLIVGEREAARERLALLALRVNTLVNLLLVGAKGVAVFYSSSISLTASLVDSALDLLSTFIILGTTWAIGRPTEKHMYPAGKRRFEPLGVLIFSVVMIVSFAQVFIESFQRALKAGIKTEPTDLSPVGMATMLATIAIKAVLWVWCSRIPSSGVQALAQDAENDVWLNIVSLSFPYIGAKINSPLFDPLGGMILSAYIIIEWIKTLGQNFANLSGKSASPDQYARMLYLVTRFNPVVEISEVECYHIGDDLVVEVDVILPKHTTLHVAHDVGETIQCMLENLDGVLRAYVHCDYSSSNPQQHVARRPPQSVPPRAPSIGDASTISGSATPTPSNPFANRVVAKSPETTLRITAPTPQRPEH